MDHNASPGGRWTGVRDDRGIALVVAIALAGLVATLMVVMVTVAIHENRSSGRDRQRSVGVMTAEGQVDTLISNIQSAPPATLPCGPQTAVTATVKSDEMTLANTITYYNAAGNQVSCAALLPPLNTEVASAKITSTSTSKPLAGQPPAVRKIETLVHLNATYANGMNRAIFGGAGVTLSNHADIYGENGLPNADVYTNGDVTCNNNQQYHGSIFSQGSVSMSNTCVVYVDVYAKTGFTATNPGVSVNGKVTVSDGSISFGPGSLGQQARARDSVTGNVCATAGKCFGGDTTLAPPPYQAFPQYNWDTTTKTAWQNDGYAVVNLPTAAYPCGNYGGTAGGLNGKVDGVAHWIYDNQATMGNTVIYADCPASDPANAVKFQGINISLNANLAVFATAGFNFSGNTQIASNSATHRLLYLIQPYNSVPQPCTADGISLNNQVTVADTIDDLLYSPCNIRKANNSTHYGQIYAGGKVIIDNNLTMYYRPLPLPNDPSVGHVVEKYSVDILYKRETNN